MRPESVLALIRHNLLLERRNLQTVVFAVAMPLVLIAFTRTVYRPVLVGEGYAGAEGTEQAVPGMAVMFALLLIGTVGFRIFEEHAWGTWDRLRAGPVGPLVLLAGKLLPSLLVVALQQAVLFGAGVGLYGLQVAGSVAALVLVAGALTLCVLAFGAAIAAFASNANQLNVLANLGGVALAGLGGALVPLSALPGWAEAVAPVTPSYWAMRGFRAVILDGDGAAGVIVPILVLLAFGTVFAVVAAARFRFDERKSSFL
jgi:ABC-2 type transport system permease protein